MGVMVCSVKIPEAAACCWSDGGRGRGGGEGERGGGSTHGHQGGGGPPIRSRHVSLNLLTAAAGH